MAERKCRAAGRCFSLGQPCLEFHTTAPFYKTSMLFLVSGAKFRYLVENLVKKSRDNQKNASWNSLVSIQKRKNYTDMLSLPAKVIVLTWLQEKCKSCPLRSQFSKQGWERHAVHQWLIRQGSKLFNCSISRWALFCCSNFAGWGKAKRRWR